MTAARTAAFFFLVLGVLRGEPLLDFPTDNRALLEGQPQDFFMHVNRDFEGEKSKPWQGGQFGFVRGPVRDGDKICCIQFHEGIDIRPVHRDPQGNPTDEVRAAAAGVVVHVSRQAGASNYGRYVVVEHRWDGCPFYTIYAHLASISVDSGQSLRQGEPLGIMGFTGAGIDRERAHIHFEVCLMLSKNFEGWHAFNFPKDPNRHGIYNGLNLVGADPAALLLAVHGNPALKISDYFAGAEPAFKITVKNSANFYLIRAYPWLVPKSEIANPPAWTITFSRYGVPIKVEAAKTSTTEPIVTWVKETDQPYGRITKNMVSGSWGSPRLTASGMRFAKLLTWPD
jgi:murein DD-endopeptidase MepM/ murein hydrolase activator NlpD